MWLAALALLASAAALGVVVHGLALDPGTLDALWQPLYLALGGSVALFVVGAIADWKGLAAARYALPVMLLVAAGFYLATRWRGGDFRVFVAYEAAALGFALAVYTGLHRGRRLPGAGLLATAFAASLTAGVVQAGDWAIAIPGFPLDHNGLFHLVQLPGLAFLGRGLGRSLRTPVP